MNTKKDKTVADSVRLILEFYQLNPTSLAAKINEKFEKEITSQTQIRRICEPEKNGSMNPTDKSLEPIAQYFQMKTHQLRDYDFVKSFLSNDCNERDKHQVISEITDILKSRPKQESISLRDYLLSQDK